MTPKGLDQSSYGIDGQTVAGYDYATRSQAMYGTQSMTVGSKWYDPKF